MSYKIYLFSNDTGSREFVVISDAEETEVVAEHGEGVKLMDSIYLDDDAGSWPCDRALTER